MSDLVLADVGEHLLQRADKGAPLVVGDAAEHARMGLGHVRPERLEGRAAGFGDEDPGRAAVARRRPRAGSARRSPAGPARGRGWIVRPRHRPPVRGSAGPSITDSTASARIFGVVRPSRAISSRKRGVVAAHDAVHQVGREIRQADLAQRGCVDGALVGHAPSLFAARKPDPPPRPGPGWVEAPIWTRPRTSAGAIGRMRRRAAR